MVHPYNLLPNSGRKLNVLLEAMSLIKVTSTLCLKLSITQKLWCGFYTQNLPIIITRYLLRVPNSICTSSPLPLSHILYSWIILKQLYALTWNLCLRNCEVINPEAVSCVVKLNPGDLMLYSSHNTGEARPKVDADMLPGGGVLDHRPVRAWTEINILT